LVPIGNINVDMNINEHGGNHQSTHQILGITSFVAELEP
jgi:hypothetical protein